MIFTWEHAISLDFLPKNLLRLVPCKRSISFMAALAMLLFVGSVHAQQTFTFTFTGGVQTFVVPAGVTLLHVDAFGAQGGQGDAPGGKGGRVETTIAVTPGETLYSVVGGAGSNSGGSGAPGPGGFNGGGDGGQGISGFSPTGSFYGGGGGGASDIRRGGTALANRLVVAGGGGGGGIGGNIIGPGGAGGDTTAAPGTNADGAQGGGGGTQITGGAGGVSTTGGTTGTDGGLGIGGPGGGGNSNSRGGGGGGAGYFGGGGGGGGNTFGGGGGGGGSSFSSGTDTIHTPGFQAGNGMIVLTVLSSSLLTLPFSVGDTWYVCQGYNGQISHQGSASLDLSTDPLSPGPTGCSSGPSASTGKPVLALADGVVKTHIPYLGYKNILCVELYGIGLMEIGHLTNTLPDGTTFKRDDQLGIVAGPYAGNGNYAHIHIQLQDLSPACKPESIPFSGQYRFEDAPDMPYDDNGTPKKFKDDPTNQWSGTALHRSR